MGKPGRATGKYFGLEKELKIDNDICILFKLVIYFMAERERDCPALSVWQSMKRKTIIRETRAMRISRRLNCASPVRRTEEEACRTENIFEDLDEKMQ
jgi:hypothetical protein